MITAYKTWSVWALIIGLVVEMVNQYFGAWLPGWATWCIFAVALVCRFISQEAVVNYAIKIFNRITGRA